MSIQIFTPWNFTNSLLPNYQTSKNRNIRIKLSNIDKDSLKTKLKSWFYLGKAIFLNRLTYRFIIKMF